MPPGLTAARRIAKRSRLLTAAYCVFDNYSARLRPMHGSAGAVSGATHRKKSVAESVRYIRGVFDDYLRYGRLSPSEIVGARVLELGHGDNVGVALLFLAAGCERVTCLDKFYPPRDERKEWEIYAALRETLPDAWQARFDRAVSLGAERRLNAERLSCVYGRGAEDAAALFPRDSFDLIISRVVLAAVYDADAGFAAMDAVLAPGGHTIHKIDLRDWGMFSDGGMHPLTFLTIPDSVYRFMASHSGRPNRQRLSYYRAALERLGYQGEILVTHVVGSDRDLDPYRPRVTGANLDGDDRAALQTAHALVREARPKLIPRFAALSDEDLVASGCFLAARKPPAAAGMPRVRAGRPAEWSESCRVRQSRCG
jgi:hypothetical protein